MRSLATFVIVLLLGYVVYSVPSAWRKNNAVSFVKFAEGGVTVDVVKGSAMDGAGDLILVPGGGSLMMGATYEFTNSKGEKRQADFCNGHPDYWKLVEAEPRKDQVIQKKI